MSGDRASAHSAGFAALADPTRRSILGLLHARGVLSAGELARAFPHISRPAVSRHLRVLRESGLVTVERSGREQRYVLGADALARLHHEWFSRFTGLFEESLAALKERVESKAGARASRARAKK